MSKIDHVVPIFRATSVLNEAKTKKEGRPIYDDIEVVEVRFPGNRQTVSVFPAHAESGWVVNEYGDQVKQTYAERWPEQYRRFKAKQAQVKEGTPIDELPFLTQGKRSELKALAIYTAEALASLDGQELKNLGQGGRELKNQAQAYIDNASDSSTVVRQAAQIADLERRLAEYEQRPAQLMANTDDAFDAMSDADLKTYIKDRTGSAPRGVPSRATLVEMARDASQSAAA